MCQLWVLHWLAQDPDNSASLWVLWCSHLMLFRAIVAGLCQPVPVAERCPLSEGEMPMRKQGLILHGLIVARACLLVACSSTNAELAAAAVSVDDGDWVCVLCGSVSLCEAIIAMHPCRTGASRT